jgi:4-diphosphocytidyl-2-C-methyl-D-erythritol kinase
MSVTVPSFAKINIGLRIGSLRPDGFHELRTVYQTIAVHDTIRVSIGRGTGIEIRCNDPRVPTDAGNTCYRMVERATQAIQARGRVIIQIEKRLAVEGGLGGGSGNAVATLLALETALKKKLSAADRLRIAAEVGSDLPLFLLGGTVLGVGRGEEVYPLPDLPSTPCVLALPEIAVSTPRAFAKWDEVCGSADLSGEEHRSGGHNQLTSTTHSDKMLEFSREISAWLSAGPLGSGRRRSGASAEHGGRAENLLLDLVRTGVENDFEKVVFPQYPELREVKRVLEGAGALYASPSGSGSAVYGLFGSRAVAETAAENLKLAGVRALVTSTLTRPQYWRKLLGVNA